MTNCLATNYVSVRSQPTFGSLPGFRSNIQALEEKLKMVFLYFFLSFDSRLVCWLKYTTHKGELGKILQHLYDNRN